MQEQRRKKEIHSIRTFVTLFVRSKEKATAKLLWFFFLICGSLRNGESKEWRIKYNVRKFNVKSHMKMRIY